MLRETKILGDSGLVDRIFIAAIWEPGLREHEQLDSKREVWRVPLRTRRLLRGGIWKFISYAEWMVRIFLRFGRGRIALVNCHSLSVMPLGVAFKLFGGSPIVYDTHELETETASMSDLRKRLSKVAERLLIRKADAIICVSNSIADWYRKEYNLEKVNVVRNLPARTNSALGRSQNTLKEKLGIQPDEILVVYQGLLSKGRGINLLLNVFSRVEKPKHIVFLGYGPLESKVKGYVESFPNVHLHPAVRPHEVLGYTSSGDVGISLIENTCLSYYYSLPNKLFEYLVSGLPVVVSDFPEMSKVVEEYQCGWKVAVEEESVLSLINRISSAEIAAKKRSVMRCRHEFDWNREAVKLYSICRQLIEA